LSGTNRKWCEISGLIILLLGALVPLTVTSAVPNADQNREPYPSGSWALGIVLPENAQFSDGGRLFWENATSVTAVIRLPNISYTDDLTLAVVSVMTQDGSILQVAAGIHPDMINWGTYAWLVQGFLSDSQTYQWVLNASEPEMMPDSWISLSIYLSSGRWKYRVGDLSTHEITQGEYAFDVLPSIKVGDQEVFALESYSVSNLVFERMGDLILRSLSIDGRNVSNGWYSYGSWDPSRNPLFVVGGLEPPPFIFVQLAENATLSWSYKEWTVSEPITPSFDPALIALIIIPIAVVVAYIGISKTRKSMR
jgi:hypothetical protein